jgi:hypothetical protein
LKAKKAKGKSYVDVCKEYYSKYGTSDIKLEEYLGFVESQVFDFLNKCPGRYSLFDLLSFVDKSIASELYTAYVCLITVRDRLFSLGNKLQETNGKEEK